MEWGFLPHVNSSIPWLLFFYGNARVLTGMYWISLLPEHVSFRGPYIPAGWLGLRSIKSSRTRPYWRVITRSGCLCRQSPVCLWDGGPNRAPAVTRAPLAYGPWRPPGSQPGKVYKATPIYRKWIHLYCLHTTQQVHVQPVGVPPVSSQIPSGSC